MTSLVTARGDNARVRNEAAAVGTPGVTTTRRCKVSVTTGDGVTHSVDVQGTSVFEVAAAGVVRMREEGWIGPLAPNAVIRVEVQPAPIVHDVPLRALQRWAGGPSISPKQELLKQPLRRA